MDENDQSHFKLRHGSMLNIFLESNLLEQIKKIQKNQNLKDESDVVIRAIQYYYEKIISDVTKFQKPRDLEELNLTNFDGKLDHEKLEKILALIGTEYLIKKLPQHEIYNMSGAGMIHYFQTKILPVKFSLMCLSKIILNQNKQWIELNEFKNYTLESAKMFLKKLNSSSIQTKFKVTSGFPNIKNNDFKSNSDPYLLLARSGKRFQEEFVGRKLQKHEGVQIGGACFEMGLIKATRSNNELEYKERNLSKIYVTLSDSGKEFASINNQLIYFVFNNTQKEPFSIFSQEERVFYFKKILPKYDFENKFVKYLMEHEVIQHSSNIKEWFKEEFTTFCKSEFPEMKFVMKENNIRIQCNTIMGRLMEFGVFVKDPKLKSGPYTRMYNMSDLLKND